MHILLVGNPNCGKTTLFNALTNDHQRVGNWPGVTVEKKTGLLALPQQTVQVTDLPGIYSLTTLNADQSLDEAIAADAILSLPTDVLINVIDACHLERHLYLTTQLLELGKPMIIVLNMSDLALQQGIHINAEQLSRTLACPVVLVQAHKKIGLDALKALIATPQPMGKSLDFAFPLAVKQLITNFKTHLAQTSSLPRALLDYHTYRALEGDVLPMSEKSRATFLDWQTFSHDIDVLLADARYQKIHQIVESAQKKKSDASEHFTATMDKLLLHRVWSLPCFLGIMYLMFLFAINIGGVFQDFVDISTRSIFVQGSAWVLTKLHAPSWVLAIIANGLGMGINTVLTFIPVIAAMFFFLAFLETSGYMARAAFVVDRIMRGLGLPGKAFVPMIVGFGCNVPAVMAARTLDSERDRVLTVLMSPFMSCSARLAIYAVFVAAFFPVGGQNVVFSLYLFGIIMAVLTGFLLRKTLFQGSASPLILELPLYHRPSMRRLIKETTRRLRHFVFRAGRIILPVCLILGGLNALTLQGGISSLDASSHSLLSYLGQCLTPLFAPMGISSDNWPATVGLVTGTLAKEVVVGALNSLYMQVGQLSQAVSLTDFNLWGSIKTAFSTIPINISHLGQALINPIAASAPENEMTESIYGVMAHYFDGRAGAFAYLLFVLLYIPCVSTMAAIYQETTRRLMIFSIVWSFIVAYASAVIFYQLARFTLHPQQSILWIMMVLTMVVLFILSLVYHRFFWGKKYVAAAL